jgi:hypothetical protein
MVLAVFDEEEVMFPRRQKRNGNLTSWTKWTSWTLEVDTDKRRQEAATFEKIK